mmetsp:Transcript_66937/g.111180  ORF Transcript_66937/g.111180 Transcript_66937/m.111180 type:complete len:102 (+) Transcript_66937:826-1131(+)
MLARLPAPFHLHWAMKRSYCSLDSTVAVLYITVGSGSRAGPLGLLHGKSDTHKANVTRIRMAARLQMVHKANVARLQMAQQRRALPHRQHSPPLALSLSTY